MRKETVLVVVIFIAVVAAFGAVYKFYFSKKLEEYAKNQTYYRRLETRLGELHEKFDGTLPDLVIAAWRGEVQPREDAITARSTYFTMADLYAYNPVPDNVIPKFYYEKEYQRVVQDLRDYAWRHMPPTRLPEPLPLGVPAPDSGEAKTATRNQVDRWLRQLNYCCAVMRMLVDANMVNVSSLTFWAPRTADEYEKLVVLHTIGVSCNMRMEDLTKFLEKMRTADRYFSVNALDIQNNELRTPWDPLLTVNMLISQAQYFEEIPEDDASSGIRVRRRSTSSSGSVSASVDEFQRERERLSQERMEKMRERMKQESNFFNSAWRWFKRTFLAMS